MQEKKQANARIHLALLAIVITSLLKKAEADPFFLLDTQSMEGQARSTVLVLEVYNERTD